MPPATTAQLSGLPDEADDDALVQELYGAALALHVTGARPDTTVEVRCELATAVARIDSVISVLRGRLES